ncbi:hypothetical protein ACH47X_15865 [Promicromonospora kroppenstedtii]|uniref:Uncharacterized protein n=1 Tax=Promicromonospora kroppenstedtii TaxID=440482 RepID=A0ABW7XMR3_9MICO
MSATRRKGSRGGRAAARAGGPPASNALTWAESLASGEAAPGASALEWAEGLAKDAKDDAAPSPWGAAASAAAPAEPAPAEDAGATPWGPVPAPAVADDESDVEAEADANPWGSVAAAEPATSRGRGKNAGGKSGKAGRSRGKGKGTRSGAKGAPKEDLTPTPAGGFPLIAGPATDEAPQEPLPDDGALPGLPSMSGADVAVPASAGEPSGPGRSGSSKAGSSKAGKGPRGRIPTPSTAQQRKIKKTLRRGLPKFLDRPLVLVLAGVVSAGLGLGAGWGMDTFSGGAGGSGSTADAASCAQTQMAWTQAANAQSAMVEDQPDTLRKGFINARNALDGVTPPEEISQEWAVAFTYYSTVANNIEKVKANDGPAVISAVGGAQQELDTEAMVKASETIGLYVNSNCTR